MIETLVSPRLEITPLHATDIHAKILDSPPDGPIMRSSLMLGCIMPLRDGEPKTVESAAHQSRDFIVNRLYKKVREDGRALRRYVVSEIGHCLSPRDFEVLSKLIDRIERAGEELI